ncbi:helix-turn-helix transcriptional regulator [Streptomyces hygroscopicus]|uniref:helix-turn-helix transcriptional regulator n=1 Tax=Streptomyces hygroscopicus TaxID=1912 RepID=UPI00076795CA|nr:helix-turn-helix transcriptional regulator [Streptomyces hygroscopicus]
MGNELGPRGWLTAAGNSSLGEFLRARRDRLTPAQAGLPPGPVRRVPGLRREEVALLAGVSTDYYVHLERGREMHPSPEVVGALARALRLDAAATDHLHRLAAASRLRPEEITEEVAPQLAGLLDQMQAVPAMVVTADQAVLAANTLARALFADFEAVDHMARMVFLDPVADGFFVDWLAAAAGVVRNLRAASTVVPSRVEHVVGVLSVRSEEFARLWAEHEVEPCTRVVRRFRHGAVGELELDQESFAVSSDPGQYLWTYSTAPDAHRGDGLPLLSTLASDLGSVGLP